MDPLSRVIYCEVEAVEMGGRLFKQSSHFKGFRNVASNKQPFRAALLQFDLSHPIRRPRPNRLSTTDAPSSAKRRAVSRPIPDAPPVTNATFSSKFILTLAVRGWRPALWLAWVAVHRPPSSRVSPNSWSSAKKSAASTFAANKWAIPRLKLCQTMCRSLAAFARPWQWVQRRQMER